MSEFRDQNPSGSDPPNGPSGADRFWEGFAPAGARARASARRPAGENGAAKQVPPAPEPQEHECLDWCPICRTADVVRANLPPELREQWQTLQRDALHALRGAIDAYLERSGQPEERPTAVEDIPIN
jgi:hypothetical protein